MSVTSFVDFHRRRHFQIMRAAELDDPNLIRITRNDGYKFFLKNGVKAKGAPDFLVNAYMKASITITNERKSALVVNAAWSPVYIDTSPLSPPDEVIDAGRGELWEEELRSYFRRTFFAAIPATVTPYVSKRHTDVFLTTVNIIGALIPEYSCKWPRNFAANLNRPPRKRPSDQS